ncbi:hypothetical protein CYMTET_23971, partial [Cymbomonas tetramitiformis]
MGLRLCIAWQRLLEPRAESKFSPEDDGTFDIPAEDASIAEGRMKSEAEGSIPGAAIGKIAEGRMKSEVEGNILGAAKGKVVAAATAPPPPPPSTPGPVRDSAQVDPSGLYGHALCLDAVREEFAPEAVLQADFVGDGPVKALVVASYPVHHKGEPMDSPMDTFDGTDVPKNISMFVWSSAIPDFAGVPATTLRAAVRVMDLHPISIRSSSKGSEMDVTCVRACGGEEEFQLAFNRRMQDAEASHPAATLVLAIGAFARRR